MIFVLESYLKNRRAKVEAWEKSRAEWANSGSYRYSRDYESVVPYPIIRWGRIASMSIPFLIGGIVITTLGIAIATAPPKKVDPNNPHDCSVVVHKGDKVGVTGTKFEGSNGVVIDQRSDCSVNLTLTHSTWGVGRCKQVDGDYCDKPKEDGEILTVENSKDIVKL